MIKQGWGFSVVAAAIVGVAIGIVIAVLAGLGSGSRLMIGAGVGLIIGGGLLTIFERLVVRRRAAPVGVVVYEKLSEPVLEDGVTVTQRAVPAFDPETGEPLRRPPSSSFVGLSLEVWTLVLVGCGILLVGVGVVLYLAS